MAKAVRWAAYGLVSLVILVLIAAAGVWLIAGQKLIAHGAGKREHLAEATPAQLTDAGRQLIVLRCVGCHNKGLRGDLFFDEPHVAKIYAPNLTAVAAKASDEQLARAIRQGIGNDGRALVIMPSGPSAGWRMAKWPRSSRRSGRSLPAVPQVHLGGLACSAGSGC